MAVVKTPSIISNKPVLLPHVYTAGHIKFSLNSHSRDDLKFHIHPDSQCTYVTLRRVRATTVAVEKQLLSLCICSLRYPACNAHTQHCHLWPAPIYNILPLYLINGKIFEKKKVLNPKRVFRFSLQFLSETFLILRRNERDIIKNVYWTSCKVSAILVRF